MKKWSVVIGVVILLSLAGFTAQWWLSPVLTFIGANTDMIQGLTDAVQLLLWLAAAVVLGWKFLFGKDKPAANPTGDSFSASAGNDATIVQGEKNTVITLKITEERLQSLGIRRPPADLTAATRQYLQYLLDRYRYLEFQGMGVSDRMALQFSLLEMFVPLKARIEMPDSGETWARDLRVAGRKMSAEEAEAYRHKLSDPQPVLDLLRHNDGLIVLGDPGAGKTTFVKYLALQFAVGNAAGIGIGDRLPILLPLSAYANALAERSQPVPLDKFIPQYYRDLGITLPLDAMLTQTLDKGGALILLDGLDEVKDLSLRHTVIKQVKSFFAFHRQKGNKFVITSRIVGYKEVRPTTDGLQECTLVDFDDAEITDFVEKWTLALERVARGQTSLTEKQAEAEKDELLDAIKRNHGVRDLASNPLLLTILALMKRQGVTLPERRVELYQKYVETLLKHWNLVRGLGKAPRRDLDMIETLKLLAPLALWMHRTSPGVGLVKREPLHRKLIEICTLRKLSDPETTANKLLSDVREHAGLLLERGAGTYGFIHLTFQEYLAAVGVAQQGQQNPQTVVETLAAHITDDNWHEVSLLTIGYMGIIQQLDEVAGKVLRNLIKESPGERGAAVVFAGEAVLDAMPSGVDAGSQQTVQKALRQTLTADHAVKPTRRAQAGDVLARLGDPRPGVGLLPSPERGRVGEGEKTSLPQHVFCHIPAGEFLMGEGKEQHTLSLPEYWMSRYPVTNTQFEAFVSDGGYTEKWRHCWTKAGWKDKGNRQAPYKEGGVFDLPNHPVMGVTWYEAVAYANWLTEQLRNTNDEIRIWRDSKLETLNLEPETAIVRLPSEAEWEKAARGVDGRRYPWREEIDTNKANYDKTGIGTTSAVGAFPGGASVYGCMDMSGNVWEWCSTKWKEEAYPFKVKNEWTAAYLASDATRVMRGGSFYSYENLVRCAVRHGVYPDVRSGNYGFRVMLSPF